MQRACPALYKSKKFCPEIISQSRRDVLENHASAEMFLEMNVAVYPQSGTAPSVQSQQRTPSHSNIQTLLESSSPVQLCSD